MKVETLQVDPTMAGSRLDKYLVQTLPQFSRSGIKKFVEQDCVLVNEQKAKASLKLKETDRITIMLPVLPERPSPEKIPLSMVYEDEDILVLDKPPGLITHPSPGHPAHTLVNAILSYCPHIDTGDDPMRSGIVHRLDKDTSGLIVIAKNDFARRYLAGQFKDRTVSKGYLVLVKGRLSPVRGIIEAPIGRDPHHRRQMAIVETGKEAISRYEVEEYLEGYTLIEVATLTGRTHQIRVHLKAIGYPVAGDPVYGARVPFLKRQFVHAHYLGFRLPRNDEYQEFRCSLPEDLARALRSLAPHIRV
ncbi:MAG: RluA family pseudouridine synthase [Dehalococcoidia bacterium]|nr:RluA family pseudouridine synthase [Dehalococcoidia bacterium]